MRTRLSVIALALAVGCGDDSPAMTAEVPHPEAPAPVIPPAEPPVEVPPASSTVAPSTPVAVPSAPVTFPGPASTGETRGPAFVVGAWDFGLGGVTIVVPVDPATPARSAPQTLVLSPAGDEVIWVPERGAARPCTGCRNDESASLSDYAVVRVDPARFVGSPSTRGLFTQIPSHLDIAPGPATEPDGEEEADEDSEEDCTSSDGVPRSIVGGRLYVPRNVHIECGGWNIYNLDLESAPLFADAPAAASWPDTATRCDPTGATAEWFELIPQWDALPCRRGDSHVFRGEGMCDECESGPDHVVPRLGNGRIQFYGARMTNDGNGRVFEASVVLTVSSCPSAADPCGPPSRFRSVIDGLGPGDRFWIASNASALIVASPTGLDRAVIRIYAQGAAAPSRELVVPMDANDIMSVRFHANAAPLSRLIDHAMSGATASAASRGECEPGTRRAGASDTACVPIPLATEDTGFVDETGGTEWGNRCALHLRELQLDAAEAACAAGLRVAERSTTQGALWFNLGRIAERRGDVAAARRAYQRSLEVRPGNPTVEAALSLLDAAPHSAE